MNKEKMNLYKRLIFIGFIILCIGIAFLIFKNPKDSESLIYEGSTKYINKTETQKKQFVIGVIQPPQQSKTYLGQDQIAHITTRLVYEPMVYIKKDLSIEYMLADNIEFSQDGLEAKIKIKKDAQFSNGDPINAQIIKDAYLSLNQKTSSYSQKEICMNIKGMEEYQTGKSQDISGVIINSDHELTFQFQTCSIRNIQGLSLPIFKVIDNEKYALGTGEYAFKNYTHNKSIELIQNKNRHTSHYPYQKIILKGISTMNMKEDIDQYNLDAFEIPLTNDMKNIKDAKYHNIYEVNDAYTLNYLEFNLNDQAGSDKNVRQTIFHSLRQSELKAGFDKNERINYSLLSSQFPSSDTYDMNKAQNTDINMKEIDYYTTGDTVSLLRYDVFNKNFKEVGISLKKIGKIDATLKYSSNQGNMPINRFEENIMNSPLKSDYQQFIQNTYQNNCQNIYKDLENYCQQEYIIVPISTIAYGLVISSDANQEQIKDLMMNS